jgi:hypothetical protein
MLLFMYYYLFFSSSKRVPSSQMRCSCTTFISVQIVLCLNFVSLLIVLTSQENKQRYLNKYINYHFNHERKNSVQLGNKYGRILHE